MEGKIGCSIIDVSLIGEKWTKEDEANVKMGDVIAVKRKKGYSHFAIYEGDGKVIHYTPKPEILKVSGEKKVRDTGKGAVVQEGTMADFLDKDKKYSIIVIAENSHIQERGNVKKSAYTRSLQKRINEQFAKHPELCVYGPDETVERAKAGIGKGEGEYKLFSNNCECFALYCKIGINMSGQGESATVVLTQVIPGIVAMVNPIAGVIATSVASGAKIKKKKATEAEYFGEWKEKDADSVKTEKQTEENTNTKLLEEMEDGFD